MHLRWKSRRPTESNLSDLPALPACLAVRPPGSTHFDSQQENWTCDPLLPQLPPHKNTWLCTLHAHFSNTIPLVLPVNNHQDITTAA